MKNFYVYILECADGVYYTGLTADMERRLNEHQSGYNPESFTYNRRPVKLVFYTLVQGYEQASILEKKIKDWSRAKKKALIDENWDKLKEAAKCMNNSSHLFYEKNVSTPLDKTCALAENVSTPLDKSCALAENVSTPLDKSCALAENVSTPLDKSDECDKQNIIIENNTAMDLRQSKTQIMKTKSILLGHGSGGKLSHELIESIFFKHFGQNDKHFATDSTLLDLPGNHIAYTTDSYVVDPIFFPGGNIGKLAVCGTVNDLAVSGAVPLYLSCGFIIEEGFEFEKLEEIVKTMADEALKAGVKIVAGDTKVVDKGKCDKIFINTSGIGAMQEKHKHISYGEHIKPGDKIIINGNIAEHGVTIIGARNNIEFTDDLHSDCASLNSLIAEVMQTTDNIRFMRDATRGGIATVLCELVEDRPYGILINEDDIPVSESVLGLCEVFGFDPLYIANEGKLVMIVAAEDASKIIESMRTHEVGRNACIIGEVTADHQQKVLLNTQIGGKRIIDMLTGEQLPRIC